MLLRRNEFPDMCSPGAPFKHVQVFANILRFGGALRLVLYKNATPPFPAELPVFYLLQMDGSPGRFSSPTRY